MPTRPVILANGTALAPIGTAAESSLPLDTAVALTLQSTSGYTSFAWTLIGRPAGSTAALTATSGYTSAFTPDEPGEYQVKGIATGADGTSSARVSVVIVLTQYAELRKAPTVRSQDIRQDVDGLKSRLNDAFDTLDPVFSDDGPSGTGLGRFLRTIRSYSPLGTSADAANWQAVVDAAASVGGEANLGPGTLLLSAGSGGITLPTKARIYHHPKAIMSSEQVKGSFTAWHYKSIVTLGGGSATLSANVAAVAGRPTDQVSSATSYTVGDWIWIGQVTTGSIYAASAYQVIAKSGSGPYDYTLDRPVLWSFLSGTRVQLITSTMVRDVVIEGYGSVLEGGADRMIETIGVHNIHVRGLRFQPTALVADFPLSFDLGTYESSVTDCTSEGLGGGFLCESGERNTFRDLHTNSSTKGHEFRDCINCHAVNCSASEFTDFGFRMGASESGVHGCKDCSVTGGRYSGNGTTATGFNLSGRALDSRITGTYVEGCNISYDIGLSAARTVLTDTHSSRALGGANGYGYYINAPGCRLVNPTSQNDSVAFMTGASAIDVVDIINPDFRGCLVQGIAVNSSAPAGSQVNVRGGTVHMTVSGITVDILGPSNVVIDGTWLHGRDFVIYHRAGASPGVCVLRGGTKITQQAGGTTGYTQAGAGVTLRVEGRVDNQCTTKYTIHASGYTSRATVTLNGTTPVDVTWPDLKVGDRVVLTRKTDGGTPGITPLIAYTAGTKFTVTGVALDTSVYEYSVI